MSIKLNAVFLIIFSATLVWCQRCDQTQAQQCFQRYAAGMSDSWPSTKEELQKKCTVYSNLVDCFKRSLENCDENVKKLFDGIGNFKTEVCDINSPMAKGFVEHSGCLRNTHADMQRCTQSKMSRGAHPCSLVSYIALCSDEIVGARCGDDANQLSKRTYGISLQAMCPQEVKEYLLSAVHSTDATPSMGIKTSVRDAGSGVSSLNYSVFPAFLLPAAMLLMRFLKLEM